VIQSTPKRLFRKLVGNYLIPKVQFSYSQFGEDLIIRELFHKLNIHKPKYLDIGANEPKYISNTYYFYEHGGDGVCVEPNPLLCRKLKKSRPRDIIINAGIGIDDKQEAEFYLFPNYANGLSTFSEKEAMHWEQVGMPGLGKIKIEKIIRVPLININNILEKHFKTSPDLLSIDVEGLDYEILASLDLTKYRPKVICAETLLYGKDQKGYKITDIEKLLLNKGYILYADTRVNSIFCLKELI
jgi:methyltransferase, FkbM family